MALDDYYTAGVAVAVSLVHVGAAPRTLSSHLYNALVYGPEAIVVPLKEMPESDLKHQLELVSSCCQ